MNDAPTMDVVTERLQDHLEARPQLAERIYRELMMELHRRGVVTIDEIHDQARLRAGERVPDAPPDANQPERPRWDAQERAHVDTIVREYVSKHFSIADIDDLVNLTLKREEVYNLETAANRGHVSFRELSDMIHRFCKLPLGETRLAPAEVTGTRVALTRHLVSDQLEFIAIAKNHLQIRDFEDITKRMVGSDTGIGRIGGKAGGMMLAHRILASTEKIGRASCRERV